MKVTIEIDIESHEEDEHVYLEAGNITVKSEGLRADQVGILAEVWGQSDWFYIDFPHDILTGMNGIEESGVTVDRRDWL